MRKEEEGKGQGRESAYAVYVFLDTLFKYIIY